MNITAKTEKNTEIKQENNVVLTEQDSAVLSDNQNVPFADILTQQLGHSAENVFDGIEFNYDTVSMSLDDAMFFVNLTREGQFTIVPSPEGSNIQSLIQTQISHTTAARKTVEVTNQLTNLIEKAQNTQKPVRISFDNDVSVILKIDKHGKVTAEFIPGSIEVENYLRNNISALRQKFDEQNLPYNDLFYRQNGRQNRKQGKERGDK